jgi:muramoyltetrapeptide carboxypeptidase
MKRRNALKNLALAPLTTSFLVSETEIAPSMAAKRLLKPARLRNGDKIAVIAPSSPVPPHVMERALTNLRNLGFELAPSAHLAANRGYLAGTEQERLDDLHTAFRDPSIKGIWCVRGGYGAARLLPNIDYDLIRRNPKVFIGYSDITALHLAIHARTGLVTFHGPVGTSDYNDYTRSNLEKVIIEPEPMHRIELSADNVKNESNLFKTQVITAGKARGKLIGGNLSLLSAAAGTPYFMDVCDKIVFIEDIDERPYRIDRMLVQLLQSLDLRKARAVALGIFDDCNPKEGENSLSLIECLQDLLGGLGIPVIYGLSFGHIKAQCTIPYGIEAELDTDSKTLTLLETAVL